MKPPLRTDSAEYRAMVSRLVLESAIARQRATAADFKRAITADIAARKAVEIAEQACRWMDLGLDGPESERWLPLEEAA